MKKRGRLEMNSTITLILLLAFVIIIVVLLTTIYGGFGGQAVEEWSCWTTNGLKSSNKIFQVTFPSTCMMWDMEEKVGKEEIVTMLKDTWWMYGKGEKDFELADSNAAIFHFTMKEQVKFDDLLTYMLKHKDGAEVEKQEISDYNYIQKGSEGQTLCLGNKVEDLEIKADEEYFILFYDDSGFGEEGDKLIISMHPNLDQEEGAKCYSPLEGYMVPVFTV